MDDSGGFPWKIRQTKDTERWDKVSIPSGKDNQAQARPVKTFRNVGDVKNGTAGL
jgi:hypothetical protein